MFCGMGSPAWKCSYYDGSTYTDAPSLNQYHSNAKLLEINDNGDLIMIAGQNNLSVGLLPYGGDEWEIISQMNDFHFKNGSLYRSTTWFQVYLYVWWIDQSWSRWTKEYL